MPEEKEEDKTPARLIEISPHVTNLHVDLSWFPQPYPPNVYLIRDGDEAALIDAGFGDDESFNKRIKALNEHAGLRIKYIVITHHHYDHSSGAQRLREATGAQIVDASRRGAAAAGAGERDRRHGDPGGPEGSARAGEEVARGGGEGGAGRAGVGRRRARGGRAAPAAACTRRATRRGTCASCSRRTTLLFSGDNVLGVGTAAIAPPPHGDMAEYIRSLKKMQAVESELLAPGHGPAVKEPHRKIQELIDHRQQREDQIIGLAGRGQGLREGAR